jgi:hypothetical protein
MRNISQMPATSPSARLMLRTATGEAGCEGSVCRAIALPRFSLRQGSDEIYNLVLCKAF